MLSRDGLTLGSSIRKATLHDAAVSLVIFFEVQLGAPNQDNSQTKDVTTLKKSVLSCARRKKQNVDRQDIKE